MYAQDIYIFGGKAKKNLYILFFLISSLELWKDETNKLVDIPLGVSDFPLDYLPGCVGASPTAQV